MGVTWQVDCRRVTRDTFADHVRAALAKTFALDRLSPTLGARLQASMDRAGKTPPVVAEELGVSIAFVYGVLRDSISPLTDDRCEQFARALGEDVSAIMRWRDAERFRRRILAGLRAAAAQARLSALK